MKFADLFEGDEEGKPSFSRVMAAMVVSFTMVWCSYTVYKTQTIPDLLGVAALLAATYGANRIGEAYVAKSVNDNAVPAPKPTTDNTPCPDPVVPASDQAAPVPYNTISGSTPPPKPFTADATRE